MTAILAAICLIPLIPGRYIHALCNQLRLVNSLINERVRWNYRIAYRTSLIAE